MLLDLWEKNNYFSVSIIEKLRNPSSGVKFHEDSMNEENSQTIEIIENDLDKQIKQYEHQHKEFVEHSTNQINAFQMQINQIIQQQMHQQSFNAAAMKQQPPPPLAMPPLPLMQSPFMTQQSMPTSASSSGQSQSQQQQQQQQQFNLSSIQNIPPPNIPPPTPPSQQQQPPSNMPVHLAPGISIPPPPLMANVNSQNSSAAQQPSNNNNGSNHFNHASSQSIQNNSQANKNQQPPQPLMSLMSLNPFGSGSQNNSTNTTNANPPQFNQSQQPSASTQQAAHVALMSIPPPTIIQNGNGNQSQPQGLDLSRPPPGFGPMPPVKPPIDQTQPIPLKDIEVPYYNLPAGLIVCLVKTEDFDYEPLDPKLVKIPTPEPPTEKLLKAVEEFYAPVSPNKPRNPEGWEKNSLYEFYKAKLKIQMLKKAEQENELNNTKHKSKSRSRSRSRSRNRSKSKSRRRSKSRSKSRSRHRSRSRSQRKSRRRRRSYSSNSHSSRSSSRSYSRSRSRSRSKSRSRTKSRTRSRTPTKYAARPARKSSVSRSLTPPFTLTSAVMEPRVIDSSNKGHQLLQKMGYTGAGGLGRHEQGIINTIEGGEVRDKVDQYKGVGMRSDPFEAFRRNKSQGYIQRLRDRDEQRSKRNPSKEDNN